MINLLHENCGLLYQVTANLSTLLYQILPIISYRCGIPTYPSYFWLAKDKFFLIFLPQWSTLCLHPQEGIDT
ncbi:MAG: hypothetical protein VXY77_00480 [Pseudomonadota bacterium]|nr:hypothetical protein [Pseudomonadota bacterium]